MNYPIRFKDIDASIDFFSELGDVQQKAISYLLSFTWCAKIKESFIYTNVGDVFCVFLFEIENTASAEDNFLWVIVGDIPSMYLDIYGPTSTKGVLQRCIDLAEGWIFEVKNGSAVDECFPFNAEPTIELAELLEKKISFMKTTLIENIPDVPLHITC